MSRDILKEVCERLFKHHNESESVCSGLEEVDKSSGPHHRPGHAYNRNFYERMGMVDKMERIQHFPKIIKDAIMLKKNEKVLEKRKHALRVYKTLKEAGAKIDWGVERW